MEINIGDSICYYYKEIGDFICYYYEFEPDYRKLKGFVSSITKVKTKGSNIPTKIGFHLTTSEGIYYVTNKKKYHACRILLIEKQYELYDFEDKFFEQYQYEDR